MTSAKQPTQTASSIQIPINIIVLAAGQGKRMNSQLPKVLHQIAGVSMLGHVLAMAYQLVPQHICVVYGHGGETVRETFAEAKILWAKQDPQLGTGHAVLQAINLLKSTPGQQGVTLVLYADVPLIRATTLNRLVVLAKQNTLAWLTMNVADPFGLGRVLRDKQNKVTAIVEEKDATSAERDIHEVNSGFLACPTEWLAKWLPELNNNNAQGEYYLTDILALAVADGCKVETISADDEFEIMGVNNQQQLAQLERIYQHENANRLLAEGVSLADPARIDVRGNLTIAEDVFIDVNCIFVGDVHLNANVKINANCILQNCTIGTGTVILPFTLIDGATIGSNARIGPYARIRPDTTLADNVHIGNFVEVKASEINEGSKANHLSYIGDTSVGKNVNIGAGTITCNFDGANKHRTVIEDNVQIGSDVQLVAPVTVKEGATIAAGTTVWKDAAAGELTLNQKTQMILKNWQRPTKKPR